MRSKTLDPIPVENAAQRYDALEAELAELSQPAFAATGIDDIDALSEEMLRRHMRSEAIRAVLPKARKAYLWEKLATVRESAAEAGNRLATAAEQMYGSEAELARLTQQLEDRHQAWAAEHVAAQNEASNYWNHEAEVLAELRALGEDI